MLEHALAYAALGWHVFPVHTAEAGICSCHLGTACDRPAKHPRTAHGLKDATTDEATIRAWWAEWPDAGIAVATGVRSGVLAVDFDDFAGEADWPHDLRALLAANTPVQETGRGGRHVLLRADRPGAATRVKAWPGVDLRGDGGYIVVAPSIHASGRRYVWRSEPDYEVAAVPESLEAVIFSGAGPVTGPGVASLAWREMPAHEVARIESALAAISADCSRDVWLRVGMALRSTGAGEQAFGLWNTWSHTAPHRYNARDQRRQWGSLTETKPGAREVTIAALFGMAKEAGWVEASTPGRGGALLAPAAPHKVGLERESIWALQHAPEPTWLIEDLIAEGERVLLVGESQSFKTFLALDLCSHIAFGLPWEGLEVQAGNVLYLPGEGRRALGKRMQAWMRAHPELREDDAKGYFELTSELPPLTGPIGRAALRATIEELGAGPGLPKIVVIDTLSVALGGADENEAAAVSGLINDFLGRLRTDFGCVSMLLHHPHKGARGAVGMSSIRGSSAIGANVEVCLQTIRSGSLCTVHLTKSKDGETGRAWHRRFEVTKLGVRPNGKPITSGWLAPADAAEAVEASEAELRDWMSWVRSRWSAWEPDGPNLQTLETTRPPNLGRNGARRLIERAVEAGYLAERRGKLNAKIYSLTAQGVVFCGPQADLEAMRNGANHHGE